MEIDWMPATKRRVLDDTIWYTIMVSSMLVCSKVHFTRFHFKRIQPLQNQTHLTPQLTILPIVLAQNEVPPKPPRYQLSHQSFGIGARQLLVLAGRIPPGTERVLWCLCSLLPDDAIEQRSTHLRQEQLDEHGGSVGRRWYSRGREAIPSWECIPWLWRIRKRTIQLWKSQIHLLNKQPVPLQRICDSLTKNSLTLPPLRPHRRKHKTHHLNLQLQQRLITDIAVLREDQQSLSNSQQYHPDEKQRQVVLWVFWGVGWYGSVYQDVEGGAWAWTCWGAL